MCALWKNKGVKFLTMLSQNSTGYNDRYFINQCYNQNKMQQKPNSCDSHEEKIRPWFVS
jgi:hypothetical protein